MRFVSLLREQLVVRSQRRKLVASLRGMHHRDVGTDGDCELAVIRGAICQN